MDAHNGDSAAYASGENVYFVRGLVIERHRHDILCTKMRTSSSDLNKAIYATLLGEDDEEASPRVNTPRDEEDLEAGPRANQYSEGNTVGSAQGRAAKPALDLCGFLICTGYTRKYAEKIAAVVRELTGSNDAWSLLNVNADLVADKLKYSSFQRRLLKKKVSNMRDARAEGRTPEEYVRVIEQRVQQQERIRNWIHASSVPPV